jgi:hypothetical protein
MINDELRLSGLRVAAAEAEADRWRARLADLAARLAWKDGERLVNYGNRARHVHGELVADLGRSNPMYQATLPLHRREMTEHYYYVILEHLKARSSGLMYGVHYYIPIIDAILAELELYGENNYPQTRERWRWLRALAERCDAAWGSGAFVGEKDAYPLDQYQRCEEDRISKAEALAWIDYSNTLPPERPDAIERQAVRHWFGVGFRQGWEDAEYPEDDDE